MAKDFTDKPLDICFNNCPQMQLEVRSVPMYADNQIMQYSNIVRCVHEEVCNMWYIHSITKQVN